MPSAVITKDFTFAASHRLHGLPADHQCARLHGHNYLIRVQLAGQIVDPGWVVDYGELKPFGQWIDQTLDHRDLNDVLAYINPTAENLAAVLVGMLRRTLGRRDNLDEISVGVSETPTTWAWSSQSW